MKKGLKNSKERFPGILLDLGKVTTSESFLVFILLVSLLALQASVSGEVKIRGFLPHSLGKQLESERIILSIPSAEKFDSHLIILTAEPHQAGSPRNMELADYVKERFLEYGLEEVHFHDTPALLSYGRSLSVEIVEPLRKKLKLAEASYAEDKYSFLYENQKVISYHAYALSADVSGHVVYANGGSPEDFAKLEEMGVDLKGKIVIMRYSIEPYSYRGYKVYMAESKGAAGAIIYSDPQDDGYVRGETYPEGSWGPLSHIQWGSIIYDWFGFGLTPFTFHWEKKEDGTWKEGEKRDRQLPRIPSIPMSAEDASEILSRLSGPVVPEGWQGGLPFTYHIGPGPVKIRMRVENEEKIATMRNVIGMIKGSQEPEKLVIAGNHRDAWIYGAYDPSSGTAALLETARALGEAQKRGFRPRRSIILANWDAEEDLLGGSTSWAKDNRTRLLKDGVVYVNLDSSACGPQFEGGSTPALADFLREVTKSVPHPQKEGMSVFDVWASLSEGGKPEVRTIVGATDYTAFQAHIGMSCIDMTMRGPYGVYHSQYDNYFWMSRIADPGFRYNITMSKILSLILWRLANADILPFCYSQYALAVKNYLEEIENKARKKKKEIELSSAKRAAQNWYDEALAFERRLEEINSSGKSLSLSSQSSINELLLEVERAMTEEEGLKSRPFFKHLIYAPQPTYRPEVLPRIYEAIEAEEWDLISHYQSQLEKALKKAAELINKARMFLDEEIENVKPNH